MRWNLPLHDQPTGERGGGRSGSLPATDGSPGRFAPGVEHAPADAAVGRGLPESVVGQGEAGQPSPLGDGGVDADGVAEIRDAAGGLGGMATDDEAAGMVGAGGVERGPEQAFLALVGGVDVGRYPGVDEDPVGRLEEVSAPVLQEVAVGLGNFAGRDVDFAGSVAGEGAIAGDRMPGRDRGLIADGVQQHSVVIALEEGV